MTKFEMMFVIYGALHLFFELAIFGAITKISEAIMSKSTWEERQEK